MLTLRQLRQRCGVTQRQMALRMEIDQGELSRMERRKNWRIGTLHRYVEALGGELRIEAVFADRSVVLDFGEK